MAYRTGEAAKMVDIAPTTVRGWTAEYADYFSNLARPPKGKARSFTFDDLTVLATIKELRSQQVDRQAVRDALAAGDRIDWQPEPLARIRSRGERTEEHTAMVTRLSATVAKYQGELGAVKEERDRLISQLAEAQADQVAAEKRAAGAEARAELLASQAERRPWYSRLFGR